MPSSELDVIIAKLDAIQQDIAGLKGYVKELNGSVRKNREDIVLLQATCLRLDVIKLSVIIGGVAAAVTAVLAVAGLL